MNIKKTTDYLFENDVLEFESIIKDFNDNSYKKFNETAKKIGLTEKIDSLLSGEIVNKSENKAALHPKYRSFKENFRSF